ncbi:hypothetical protein BD414DRAFT_499618 [Trametes punicea]|nr:hypothetical protein BD414DRAFT_499618 [Trametes punicea]
MHHRGFEAWVAYSDGERLPEFEVRYAGRSRATCYIPSESGKRFIVCWKYHSGEHRGGIQIKLDGVEVGQKACRPGEEGQQDGVRTSADACYSFQFANLWLTCQDGDDDREDVLDEPAPSLEKLGTISVRMYHIKSELGPARPFKPRSAPFTGICTVDEKSEDKDQKPGGGRPFGLMGAHCVKLGEKLRLKKPVKGGCPTMSILNKGRGPYVNFVFHYRPAVVLQAEGIMPPCEMKSQTDDEDDSESEEEDVEVKSVRGRSVSGVAAVAKACLRRARRLSLTWVSWR